MKSESVKQYAGTAAFALLAILTAGNAVAATYNLTAAPYTTVLPDGQSITMWGYCQTPATGTCTPTMQAPALVVPVGDMALQVKLTNTLPEATSIVIPGLQTTFAPVYFTDGAGRQRAKSFVAEAAANNGTATYSWTVKPGTYLYHSGSHPGIQVQMGLYGAVTAYAGAGVAYSGVPFVSEVTLLYSEIDKCLHDAVSTGVYGSTSAPAPASCGPNELPTQLPNQTVLAAPTAPTSPMYYAPTYYMVNGGNLSTYAAGSAPVLLRFLNAGNKTHIPELINGGYMKLVAEDGNPYQYPQNQYSAFLPAGKTMDALWTPPAAGTYGFLDKSGNNNTAAAGGTEVPGGMMVRLTVGTANPLPTANPDFYTTVTGVPLSTTSATGVLSNDVNTTGGTVALGTTTTHGALTLNSDGSFTYTPTNNTYVGTDTFTYSVTVGTNTSNTATVTITLTAPLPKAVNDVGSTPQSTPITLSVLSNDTNSAGVLSTNLVVTNVTQPAGGAGFGSVLADPTQKLITYTPPSVPDPAFVNPVTFTYQARDTITNLVSTPATVSITVTNIAPVAVADSVTTTNTASVPINVLANDYAPGSTLNAASVKIASAPVNGTATVNAATGVITYKATTPNFVGSDTFAYTVNNTLATPLNSNPATVTVHVIAPNGLLANPDTATTTLTAPVTIPVLNNDVNSAGITGAGAGLSVTTVVQPAAGLGTATTNGTTITYTPPAGGFAVGTLVTFQYQATDTATGFLSTLATVTVAAGPVITSITPNSGTQSATGSVAVPVTISGLNLAGATSLTVSASGVTVTNFSSVSSTQINATLNIASNATPGAHTVAAVTPLGTSGTLPFTVVPAPPTLTSIAPAAGLRGTTVTVTLNGTYLSTATTVTSSIAGITATGLTVVSDTQLTANFVIDPAAPLGPTTMTVTTAGGISAVNAAVTFTVQGPTLTSIAPPTGALGYSVPVTITGVGLTGATAVNVPAGSGITVSGVTVVNATTITATFAVATTAPLGGNSITVTTPIGVTPPVTFTVVTPPAPTITGISPVTGVRGSAVPVTITGTNLLTATAVTVSGNTSGITVSGVTPVSDTQITAVLTISATAPLAANTFTVTTLGGTSAVNSAVTFTVTGPTLSSITPAAGNRGYSVPVTITGAGLTGATAVNASTGITVSNFVAVNATTVTATFAIATTATLGANSITVTTPIGITTAATFTVNNPPAPTLTAISPTSGLRGTTVPVTLTGTNLLTTTGLSVSGTGFTVTAVTPVSDTQVTASIVIGATATLGANNVTVTTLGGNSNPVTFTVVGATLSSIAPATGARGYSVPLVTITGANLTGATAVNAPAGITVSNFVAVNATTVTAAFAIAPTATLGANSITVTTPIGTTPAVTFTVANPATPTLTTVAPTSVTRGSSATLTLTGANLLTTTGVTVTGTGNSVSGFTVNSDTQVTATLLITAATARVSVTTLGGTSNLLTLTVNNPPAPTLTAINPATGSRGATVPVTLTGTNLTGATAITVSGTGVTASGITVVSATSVTANFAITTGATLSARTVSITTPGGTSGTVTFTVTAAPPPTLTTISPATGNQGATVPVTLTGTNLTGATAITVSGTGVTASGITVVSATSVTANLVITGTAATGVRTVSITTPGGTGGAVTFTVATPPPPTLATISPATGNQGATVPVTLTGTNLTGASAITVSGTGVTASGITVVSATSVTANLVITGTAATGVRTVSITTPGGTGGAVTFTVATPPAPALTSIAPNSGSVGAAVSVTLTGTNLTGATAITVSGAGVTVSGITVVSATSVRATFTIAAAAATTARAVSITTPGGISNTVAFTVTAASNAPTLTSISPSSGSVAAGAVPLVTITGTNLGLTSNVTATGGILVYNIVAPNDTTVTVYLATDSATVGTQTITVTTPTGTATIPFTITP